MAVNERLATCCVLLTLSLVLSPPVDMPSTCVYDINKWFSRSTQRPPDSFHLPKKRGKSGEIPKISPENRVFERIFVIFSRKKILSIPPKSTCVNVSVFRVFLSSLQITLKLSATLHFGILRENESKKSGK